MQGQLQGGGGLRWNRESLLGFFPSLWLWCPPPPPQAHGLANTSFWHQNIRFSNSGFSNRDIRGGGISWECRRVYKVVWMRRQRKKKRELNLIPRSISFCNAIFVHVCVTSFASVFVSVFVSVFLSVYVSVFVSEFVFVFVS